jgi:hypothetical protein
MVWKAWVETKAKEMASQQGLASLRNKSERRGPFRRTFGIFGVSPSLAKSHGWLRLVFTCRQVREVPFPDVNFCFSLCFFFFEFSCGFVLTPSKS